MAFLCPVRIRRSKKKGEIPPPPNFFANVNNSPGVSPSPPGRITGSNSIETLVRVGLEKEAGPSALFSVLHDFSPCVDDELAVRKSDVVSLLYREHDWAYVIDSKSPPNEGFIPFSYITPLKEPETNPLPSSLTTPFPKTASDSLYLNLYTFTASDENDLSLERGAVVNLLNDEDPDWFWVSRPNGEEGFVPSAFLHRLNPGENPTSSSNSKSNQQPSTSTSATTTDNESQPQSNSEKNTEKGVNSSGNTGGGGSSKGVELVMLYDYKAQAADDLSVKRGDWVHADLSVQTVSGWLWAYSPKQKKYGFIPRTYAKPPAMTSL